MPTDSFIVIPLDARPVCYQWVRQLGAIGQWSIKLPPTTLLGQLKQPANHTALHSWFQRALLANATAPVILAVDTCVYGGLIPSRLHHDEISLLKDRLAAYLELTALDQRPVYAFSSIMRIPSYNNDEEEPAYWAQYGQQLYHLSVQSHEQGISYGDLATKHAPAIPSDVVQDMITRRYANAQLNLALLDYVTEGTITQLRFGQDDTGPFGLNVQEAQALQTLIDQRQLGDRVGIQTGCDELAGVMLANAIQENAGLSPVSLQVRYEPESAADVMARFDGIPLKQVVERQQQALGLQPVAAEGDIQLCVAGPQAVMGDWCEGKGPDVVQTLGTDLLGADFARLALADVACANGGQPDILKPLMALIAQKQVPLAYAGWNTPGNTVGSALALAKVVLLAKRDNRYQSTAHRLALLTRLLDDNVYQPMVRAQLRQHFPSGVLGPDDDLAGMTEALQEALQPSAQAMTAALGLDPCLVNTVFPCHRSFEIQVDVALQPNTKLTAVTNDRIQMAVELQQAKARRTRHQWLIETTHPIVEAWETGIQFDSIYQDETKATPLWNMPTRTVAATDNVMKKLSTTQTPPELVGVTLPMTPSAQGVQALDHWLSLLTAPCQGASPRILLGCWGLQDPGNLGTLIRSACAFSVAGVILIEPDVAPDNPKVIRATAGQGFRLPMITLSESAQLWSALEKAPNVTVWATDVSAGNAYHVQDWSTGCHLILLGNEAHGLPPLPDDVKKRVRGLHIPMAPGVESINVAMAGTILLGHIFASTVSPQPQLIAH